MYTTYDCIEYIDNVNKYRIYMLWNIDTKIRIQLQCTKQSSEEYYIDNIKVFNTIQI